MAISSTVSAVAGAVVGRSRGRTVPRGRAGVQSKPEEKNEEAQSSESAPGRPLTPTRRVAPDEGGSGGSTPTRRKLAPEPISGVPAAYVSSDFSTDFLLIFLLLYLESCLAIFLPIVYSDFFFRFFN